MASTTALTPSSHHHVPFAVPLRLAMPQMSAAAKGDRWRCPTCKLPAEFNRDASFRYFSPDAGRHLVICHMCALVINTKQR